MRVTVEPGGGVLRQALVTELRRQYGGEAPEILAAWSRGLPSATGGGVVMFARVEFRHRSSTLEASGRDGDTAFRRLVDRVNDWTGGPT